MKADPSTSSTLATIEPTRAAWTTADEPGPEREDPDEELGQVAEGGLHDAGHPGAETIPEPVDAAPDDGGEKPSAIAESTKGSDAARCERSR